MRKIYFIKPDLWSFDWESGEIIFNGKTLGPKGNLVPEKPK
jgi:hypothetical protein